MKILYPDKITSIAASSENANYLKENISDDYRGRYWAAGTSTLATLTLGVSADSNALALSNTNSVTVTVQINNSIGSPIYGPTAHTMDSTRPDLWVDYTLATGTTQAIITFSSLATAIPYCGVVRAGYAYDFPNPQYGLSESMEDLSIVKKLNNGATYYKKRDIIRTFSGSLDVDRDTYFYVFMYTIFMNNGQSPLFWRITDLSGQDWTLFARLNGSMPSGSHANYNNNTISFSLVEDPKSG